MQRSQTFRLPEPELFEGSEGIFLEAKGEERSRRPHTRARVGRIAARGERTFKRRQPLHRGDCKRSRLPRLLLFYKSFQKNAGNISKQIPEVSLNFSC